jgi:hypothetical protein
VNGLSREWQLSIDQSLGDRLLSITNDNGDTLHIFLSAQGWEQLRQTIHQRTLQAADS